jgi:hypothetical protein
MNLPLQATPLASVRAEIADPYGVPDVPDPDKNIGFSDLSMPLLNDINAERFFWSCACCVRPKASNSGKCYY